MSVAQAAYETIHSAEGGGKVIAAKLGISYQVLMNKVNPNNSTHHLSLSESVNLIRASSDTRIIEAMANEFGGTFVPLANLSEAPPNLISDLATMAAEFGALMREVAEDVSDGQVSDNELARVEREAANLRHALAVLLADLRRMNQGLQTVAPAK